MAVDSEARGLRNAVADCVGRVWHADADRDGDRDWYADAVAVANGD
ncbi:hypothetical protein [Arthrobacter sp. OY3WO11]|nr:hypothetical protein [Arthrobacter sp. OY3WO11]